MVRAPPKFQTGDIEIMRELLSKGAIVRKLARDFGTSQWMVARLTNSAMMEALKV